MSGIFQSAANVYILYEIIRRIVTPWENWPSFKTKVIDDRGNVLIPENKRTNEQKESFTLLDNFTRNLKKVISLLPGGNSALVSYGAAALLLLHENKEITADNIKLCLLEQTDNGIKQFLLEAYNFKRGDKVEIMDGLFKTNIAEIIEEPYPNMINPVAKIKIIKDNAFNGRYEGRVMNFACDELEKTLMEAPNYSRAAKIATLAFTKPEYKDEDDTEHGYKERIWRDPNLDYVRDEDVRRWLLNKRVIEDLESGLEYLRPAYIEKMIHDDYLRKVGGFYWVTQKAAYRFKLPKVMGKDFLR